MLECAGETFRTRGKKEGFQSLGMLDVVGAAS